MVAEEQPVGQQRAGDLVLSVIDVKVPVLPALTVAKPPGTGS